MRFLGQPEQLRRVSDQPLSGARQHQLSAGPVEKPSAKVGFQRLDLLGYT
jgi:hypothetical protein